MEIVYNMTKNKKNKKIKKIYRNRNFLPFITSLRK